MKFKTILQKRYNKAVELEIQGHEGFDSAMIFNALHKQTQVIQQAEKNKIKLKL